MCGFVGVIGTRAAAPEVYMGLQAIQHRGQDAAGVGTFDGERFYLYKDLGAVVQALPQSVVGSLEGRAGIGHVRYPTLGGGTREDAQPFLTRRPGILMAHNGNLTNLPTLEVELRERGLFLMSRSDSEAIMLVLADELTRLRFGGHTLDDLVAALGALMDRVRGSYTVVALLEVDGREALIGFRDPLGLRPGVFGRREDGSFMIASESVALDALGFTAVDLLPPGGLVLLRDGEAPVVRQVRPARPRPCVFERIYFARADSVMEGGRVNTARWRLGERLADEWRARGLSADVIVAIPDTSRPAAMAMAERLGIPNREGFIKNRYSGRTFIMPDPQTRETALRLKLNPIAETFEGKRVILVDDSVVRGATMRRIVQMVRTTRPAAIHVAVFSPPVRNPCYYGIDMPSRDELVAAPLDDAHVERRLAAAFGVDSVTFLSRQGLEEVAGDPVCAACFTGDYPVPITDGERGFILGQRRSA